MMSVKRMNDKVKTWKDEERMNNDDRKEDER
jgi:hypothetical protein